jgi:RHS repeat-associated protein/uncharacterized repeat protein (TIGR01451 family)
MRYCSRIISIFILVSLLSSMFPPAQALALNDTPPPNNTSTQDPPLETSPVIQVTPVNDPQLPSLSLHAELSADTVEIGDIVTATVTLINSAPYPANNVVVTLPLPVGTQHSTVDGSGQTVDGWLWNIDQFLGNESITLTAVLQINVLPDKNVLLIEIEAQADELEEPLLERGGALVLSDVSTQAAANYRTGNTSRLRSVDHRVTVDFPEDGFTSALSLEYSAQPTEEAQAAQKASYVRVFGAFSLHATDTLARSIHEFTAPITVTVQYSPELLSAWNIAEHDLTLMWFDPEANLWVPIPSFVDPIQQQVIAQVNHFSDFALGDGSSPSEAYLPSVKGFQHSTFTGAASYNYSIDIPAGPAGFKPSLSLSYSSGATDGVGGQRLKQQAGWVGMGWSLDTGSVSVKKLPNGEKTYSLAVDGQSYDLVRGNALVGSPSMSDPTHWDWRPVDESFVRVRVIGNGSSTSTRGGYASGNPYPRYTWQLWSKSGVRYDFSDDVWWGWHYCGGTGDYAYMEPSRWLLTTVTDTHGNTINYTYGRDSLSHAATCFHVQGTIDRDIWPETITWAGGRYQVSFVSSIRSSDNLWEGASNQYGGVNGQPRQTRRLDAIKVWSKQASTWELVSQYNLSYDYSLRSDALLGTGCPSGMAKCPDNAYPRLTLKSIQQVGKDGTSALPATTFTYGAFSAPVAHGQYWAGGSWNRLTTINNGQGGIVTIDYDNIGQIVGNTIMDNLRRVKKRTVANGVTASQEWLYTYGTPAMNSLGTTRGPASAWGGTADRYGPYAYPTSAALYYNAFVDVLSNNRNWLTHQSLRSFHGHDWVQEQNPNGGRVKHYFYQGASLTNPHCTPTVTGGSITSDTCFQSLRNGEALKGKEYLTQYFTSSGTLLKETATTYKVLFLDYTTTPLTGLWRNFVYPYQIEDRQYEGHTTPLVSTTKTFYNTNCTDDTTTTVTAAYGNVGCVQTFLGSTLERSNKTWYSIRNDSSGYILDRASQEVVADGAGQNLTITNKFYDNFTNSGTAPTKGDLWRVLEIYDVPIGSSTGITMHGKDTTYTYDTFGNELTVKTYAQPGTRLYNGSTTSFSTPGNGSIASTTTTVYETVFNTFPIQITNPLGHVDRASYDYRMGALFRVTGANTTGTPTACTGVVPATEQSTCATYDVFGRLSSIIKPGDSITYPTVWVNYYDTEIPFRYRINRREVAGTTQGRVEQQFYDGLGRLIQTKQEGRTGWVNIITNTRYDGLDQVIEQSQPQFVTENGTTTYQYTNPGTGSLYNATTTTYDALGRPIRVTTPDGKWTEHQYSLYGGFAIEDVVDPNRHRTQYRKDQLGRLRQVVEVAGNCGTGSYSWASCTGSYTTTWAAEATTNYAYDALDRLVSTTDTFGNVNSVTYDSLGRKLTTNDRDMGLWRYIYDANGQVVGQRDARGFLSTFSYDALGRLTSVFNDDQVSFIDRFDTHNTTDWVWSGHQTVPYTDGSYTVARNVGTNSSWAASMWRSTASITSGKGISLRFKVSTTTPDALFAFETGSGSSYRRFGVLVTGNTIKMQVTEDGGATYPSPATLINGVQVNAWYNLQLVADDVGGFTAQIYQEGNPTVRASFNMPMTTGQAWRFRHWTYRDTVDVDSYVERNSAAYGYDVGTFGKGQRTSMANPASSSSWVYDARGRLVTSNHAVTGMTGTRSFSRTYDSADRLTTLTYPSIGGGTPQTITYGYDEGWGETSLYTNIWNKYLVADGRTTASGQPDQWTLAESGIVQDWSYHSVTQRLNQLRVYTASSNLFNRGYAYDNIGNITGITDHRDATNNQTYTYDHQDRLTSWTRNGVTQTYTYNSIGNLTSKTGVGVYSYPAGGATSVRPHAPTSVNGASYSYDANGNLLSGGGRTYIWDSKNLPKQVTYGSTTESYSYNADGQRVRKNAGGTTTIYLEGIWEEDIGGAVTHYFKFQGQPVALYTSSPSAFTYLHNDHIGSAGLTTSSSGALLQTQEYDPWGKVRSGGITSTDLNFTGQRLDDTGLLYYNARMYDPVLARFISADSVIPGSGPLTVTLHDSVEKAAWSGGGGAPNNPQDLNRYAYTLNNPLNATDPTGHIIDVVLDVGFIAYGIYDIAANGYTHEKGLALALDVGAALVPGVTGAGMAIRAANKIEAAADLRSVANKVEAGTTCSKNSFSGDTPVATPEGAVPISTLEIGDLVYAWHEDTNSTDVYTITDTISHIDAFIVLLTIDDELLDTTVEHPFYTLERGWVDAIDLRLGEHIPQLDGEVGVVTGLSYEFRSQPMYNLTVAEAHTFFVGDEQWLVHNCGLGEPIDRLYRAVSIDEARQLKQTGEFRTPNTAGSLEGKFFAMNVDDANTWGQRMMGEGNYVVVAAKVPASVPHKAFDKLDTIGPARFYHDSVLSKIRYRGPVRKP